VDFKLMYSDRHNQPYMIHLVAIVQRRHSNECHEVSYIVRLMHMEIKLISIDLTIDASE
jgi:hypothetical protein